MLTHRGVEQLAARWAHNPSSTKNAKSSESAIMT